MVCQSYTKNGRRIQGDLGPVRLMYDVTKQPGVYLAPMLTWSQSEEKDKDASFNHSKGAWVNWCNTRDKFQVGTPLHPLGRSLWKLSKRRVWFSSFLIWTGTGPNLLEMADQYPSIVLGWNFFSWKRYRRKSATSFTGSPLCLIGFSSRESLRSLNSFRHPFRESLNCRGSRSQAWRLRFTRFLCGILVEVRGLEKAVLGMKGSALRKLPIESNLTVNIQPRIHS